MKGFVFIKKNCLHFSNWGTSFTFLFFGLVHFLKWGIQFSWKKIYMKHIIFNLLINYFNQLWDHHAATVILNHYSKNKYLQCEILPNLAVYLYSAQLVLLPVHKILCKHVPVKYECLKYLLAFLKVCHRPMHILSTIKYAFF